MNLPTRLNDPRTNWKFIAIVAVFGFLAGGLMMISQRSLSQPQPIQVSQPQIHKPAPKETQPQEKGQTEIDTADWQTYRNDEFGFEFQYPGEWEIRFINESPVFERKTKLDPYDRMSLAVVILDTEEGKTVEETLKEYTSIEETGLSIKQLEELGIKVARSFSVRDFGENSFYYIRSYLFEGDYGVEYSIADERNSRIVRFMLFSGTRSEKTWADPGYDVDDEPDHVVLKQILSTFRFSPTP